MVLVVNLSLLFLQVRAGAQVEAVDRDAFSRQPGKVWVVRRLGVDNPDDVHRVSPLMVTDCKAADDAFGTTDNARSYDLYDRQAVRRSHQFVVVRT